MTLIKWTNCHFVWSLTKNASNYEPFSIVIVFFHDKLLSSDIFKNGNSFVNWCEYKLLPMKSFYHSIWLALSKFVLFWYTVTEIVLKCVSQFFQFLNVVSSLWLLLWWSRSQSAIDINNDAPKDISVLEGDLRTPQPQYV